MKIGIIGAGTIGQAFAKTGREGWLRGGDQQQSRAGNFNPTGRELGSGITPATVQEAAGADIVLVAVRSNQLRTALADLPRLEWPDCA